ncbi:MAG: hypothetical protein Q8P67_03260, partial [archaeon]|nr:hypothetical protein [archaeon]
MASSSSSGSGTNKRQRASMSGVGELEVGGLAMGGPGLGGEMEQLLQKKMRLEKQLLTLEK